MDIWLLIIFTVLMLPGLLGSFLPIPGMSYMFVVALGYGLVDNFQHLTWRNLLVLGLILFLSIFVDVFSGMIGAKYGGASKQSILAGALGMIIGTLALPPFGGLLGIFLAVLVWEIRRKSTNKKALRAASASLIGSISGMLASLVLSIIFIVLFIVFAAR